MGGRFLYHFYKAIHWVQSTNIYINMYTDLYKQAQFVTTQWCWNEFLTKCAYVLLRFVNEVELNEWSCIVFIEIVYRG